jgi:hypothetical protein
MASALMFDPGVSTGITYWEWTDKRIAIPVHDWQIYGGTEALDQWIDEHWYLIRSVTHIGSEKFIPRPLPGMSHTLESTYPLVQEGILIAREVMPHYPNPRWQPATCQYPVGGDTPEERKRRMDDLMKRAGLWQTGVNAGDSDANDILSARRHMVYLLTRRIRHQPTISWFYGEEN